MIFFYCTQYSDYIYLYTNSINLYQLEIINHFQSGT